MARIRKNKEALFGQTGTNEQSKRLSVDWRKNLPTLRLCRQDEKPWPFLSFFFFFFPFFSAFFYKKTVLLLTHVLNTFVKNQLAAVALVYVQSLDSVYMFCANAFISSSSYFWTYVG